jgi:hypothetical protein
MRHQSRRLAAMVARADQQHAWVPAGNECGIYGAAATKRSDSGAARQNQLLPRRPLQDSHGGGLIDVVPVAAIREVALSQRHSSFSKRAGFQRLVRSWPG